MKDAQNPYNHTHDPSQPGGDNPAGPEQPAHPFYGYPPAYAAYPGQMPEGAATPPPPGVFPGYGYPPAHAMPGYYPPPPPPANYYPGYYPPPYPFHPGYEQSSFQGPAPEKASRNDHQASDEISGLAGLGKLLDFEDKDFWKGALLGAAAVFILSNDSVQEAILRGAGKARDKVKSGVDGVRDKIHKTTETEQSSEESAD